MIFKQTRKKSKISKLILPSLVLVIVIIAIVSTSFLLNIDSFGKNSPGSGFSNLSQLKGNKATNKGLNVKIPIGAGTEKVAEILNNLGVIDNSIAFKLISKIKGFDDKYKSGTFFIEWNMSYLDMMKTILGSSKLVKVVIPEYMNIYQLAETLKKAGLDNTNDFVQFSNNVKCSYNFAKFIPDSRIPRYEGYLFPATYMFEHGISNNDVVNILLLNFNKRFTSDKYQKASKMGMTPDQVVILASIVEREAKNSSEFRRVAGVFINRLAINMKLQSDATINYYLSTLKDKSSVKNVKFTEIDTSYNTYKHPGLTPGPICSPSELAIDAVLNYEKHNFYYFLAKPDGTTQFSKNLAQHNQAVAKYLN